MRRFLEGKTALAEAAIMAGCRFSAGYPIRPVTEIQENLSQLLPASGGVYMPAANEIEAITMVYGAAAGGTPAMVVSSSTGISLMQETISDSATQGIPIVVVNGCRFVLQADYHQSVKGGGHGDYRVIVLAPGSTQELIDLTALAFQLAWKYRHPAFILADTLLLECSESIDLREGIESILTARPPDWAVTGMRTGEKRREAGGKEGTPQPQVLTGNPGCIQRMQQISAAEVRFEEAMTEDADVVLVAFGSVGKYVRLAVRELRRQGIRAGYFRPITLWPFPSEALNELAGRVQALVCVELNQGQMYEDVKAAVEGRCRTLSIAGDGNQDTGFGLIWSKDELVKRVSNFMVNNFQAVGATR